MNPRRSNRTLVYMSLIMGLVTTLIVSNVLFTMITKTHLRSSVNIIDSKEGSNTNETKVTASRGTIYDRNGEVIAHDETTYDIILYVNKNRLKEGDKPAYVDNIDKTARLLAEKLSMEKTMIVTYLEDAQKNNQYQTELGYRGKNLSASVKESIEALKLPGVEFNKTVKRDYPNGVFASHLIGFAQYDEEQKKMEGKMGLEATLNEYLMGEDGKVISQKDKDGNNLPGTTYVQKYVQNGNDVVLTLDQNVQLALETLMQKTLKYPGKPQNSWSIAMEVETGRILGWSSYPTFDLNTRENIENYINIPSDFAYEPGSVLKGVTYSAALQEGKYPYNEKFKAGFFYYNYANGKIVRVQKENAMEDAPITDSATHDILTFDEGFAVSSNIAICELLTNYINTNTYVNYLKKFGFLKSVDIPFIKNAKGNIDTSSVRSSLAVGFGQSLNVTALQMVQAYTAILNDGKMVRPYIVDKIEDSSTHNVIKQYDTEVVGTPISKETSRYVQKLMKKVMEKGGTGYYRYKMDDIDILAKTGTGEISGKNGYRNDLWTNSVIAAAPADNPKVLIYHAFQSGDIMNFDGKAFKTAMREVLTAQGITKEAASNNTAKKVNDYASYTMPSLVNHSMSYANEKLKHMKINQYVIGNGDSVISQYPDANASLISNQNVFILTNGTKITMPDMIGWTMKDITAFWKMTGIQIQMEGSGSVYQQNVKKGKGINTGSEIRVKLK